MLKKNKFNSPLELKFFSSEFASKIVNTSIKIWLVPSTAVDCDNNKMLSWTPALFLFEE